MGQLKNTEGDAAIYCVGNFEWWCLTWAFGQIHRDVQIKRRHLGFS